MGAGLAGSMTKGVNVNQVQFGDKLQGLAPQATHFFVAGNGKAGWNQYRTRANGNKRNFVFCMNQLGGVGASRSQFKIRGLNNPDGTGNCLAGPYSLKGKEEDGDGVDQFTTVDQLAYPGRDGNITDRFTDPRKDGNIIGASEKCACVNEKDGETPECRTISCNGGKNSSAYYCDKSYLCHDCKKDWKDCSHAVECCSAYCSNFGGKKVCIPL
jgi:hypothetical protein